MADLASASASRLASTAPSPWPTTTPREDLHVHSTWSDGAAPIAANLAAAERRGLIRLGCVDHVRRDTAWVPDFVAEVTALRRHARLELVIGVEAKLLDQSGTLDAPAELPGVERIYAADHQLPLGDTCLGPRAVRGLLADGAISRAQVIDALVDALVGAAARYPRMVVAHLFSALPKVGISEDEVDDRQLARLAEALVRRRVAIEIDEQWSCPGPRIARALASAGVPIWASSDSHRPDGIGVYDHVHAVFAEVGRG